MTAEEAQEMKDALEVLLSNKKHHHEHILIEMKILKEKLPFVYIKKIICQVLMNDREDLS